MLDHVQFTLIHGPNILGSYVILFFTTLDFTFTTRHIHNWASFPLFELAYSFLSELFLHSSPVAYWAPTDLGSSSFSVISFCPNALNKSWVVVVLKWHFRCILQWQIQYGLGREITGIYSICHLHPEVLLLNDFQFLKLTCASAQTSQYSVPLIWNEGFLHSTLRADFGGRMRFGVVLKINCLRFTHLVLFICMIRARREKLQMFSDQKNHSLLSWLS